MIEFQGGRGVVGDLDAGRQTVEDAIASEDGVRLRRYQHAGLRVAEDVVLLQDALAAVEDTNAAVSSVKDFIPLQKSNPKSNHSLLIEELTQLKVLQLSKSY